MRYLLVIFTIASCTHSFDERPSEVDHRIVIAVTAEPAEVRINQPFLLTLVMADPAGPLTVPAIWSLCKEPPPLSDNNAIASSCLFATGSTGVGGPTPTAMPTVPSNACMVFGPEAPAGDARPRTADDSGGFYLPVRLEIGNQVAFFRERITCQPANVALPVAQAYRDQYRSNNNPSITALAAKIGGDTVTSVPAGQSVSFELDWSVNSQEDYVAIDAFSRLLVDRRESLLVSWFATGGEFASDRTGAAAPGSALSLNNWTAPASPGTVFFWAVLRDDRGGSAVLSTSLQIN